MKNFPFTFQKAADDVVDTTKQLADALQDTVVVVQRVAGDLYSQASGMSDADIDSARAAQDAHWNGKVAYSKVTSSYLNPRTGLMQFGGVPVEADGRRIGTFMFHGGALGDIAGARQMSGKYRRKRLAPC